MSPRRATTIVILWTIVALALAANLVGRSRPRGAEPLFVAMERLSVLGVRIARFGSP